MKRAFILVLDSFGIGEAPDAAKFGDVGANTLGHIADWCAAGRTDKNRMKAGPLSLPNLDMLGLGLAAKNATGTIPAGLDFMGQPSGLYGACREQSFGKDTPSGHWEMAGVPVRFDWGYFQRDYPSFPKELTDALITECCLPGVLGNCHASGTVIINELGDDHITSGKPIVYTSADSVFQIAAHENHFGLDHLYEVCDVARKLVDPYNIGRVIARPFVGTSGEFERTGNRRDIATPPPSPTLLDKLSKAGHEVISVGKIADIFAHLGVTQKIKATGLHALFDATLQQVQSAPDGALVFVNFVDFDSAYGHRRDVAGYANALEEYDARLPELLDILEQDDLVIMTADHGCDPTWPGSDHTREFVPFLAYAKKLRPRDLGVRDSFADIGQTVADHLGITPISEGISVLE